MPIPPQAIDVALVEDDEGVRRALARFMRAAGLQPHLYESAEQFLADRAWAGFGCLVLDVGLGGMSGLQLATALADEGVRVPIIFVTASDEAAIREAARRVGGAAFYRKSDPGALLLDTIRRVGRAAGTALAPLRGFLHAERTASRASSADQIAELERLFNRARSTAESMSRMAGDARTCVRRSRELIAYLRRVPGRPVAAPDAGRG